MAQAWELVGIVTGLVLIVGIITLWWRRALSARDRAGGDGSHQDR